MSSYLQLKELNHDNITPFVGACIETGHICYLMQCCSRGTIQVSQCVTRHRLALCLVQNYVVYS